MSKKTKWILFISVLLTVSLIVLGKLGVFGKDEGIKVTAEKVQRRTIIELVNASGKVYPEIEVKVSPDISGEITELTVKEGDTVKKGQLLAKIYADIYSIQRDQASSGVDQTRAQLANAESALSALLAQMEQAQRNYNMQKKLFDEKVISLSEFNLADASLKTAKANYDAAKEGLKGGKASIQSAQANYKRASKDLGRTFIVSPMDGVVSLLNVKKGEKVAGNSFNIGTEILRIADMRSIEVRVDVGENDITKVKLGDSAVVDIDAYSDRKFKGIVTQIASSNNGAAAQSGLVSTTTDVTQYKVYIRLLPESYTDLLNKGSFPFKPGMSASADIQTKTEKNVLSVPINAVTTRDKNEQIQSSKNNDKEKGKENDQQEPTPSMEDLEVVVFVVNKENKVKKVLVKTGIQDINYIEIKEGLKEGEEVVTGPYDVVSKTLKVDDKIKKVDKKELFEKK
jgi:HlyD family secretion protein